jgi:hypothetical protein
MLKAPHFTPTEWKYILGFDEPEYNAPVVSKHILNPVIKPGKQLELFPSPKRIKAPFVECDRCDGYGFILRFRHIQKGRCFKCSEKRAETIKKLSLENL